MEDHPALKIRIQGHTDNQGEADSNLVLSENRAKAVFNFLIDNGIDATRLSYLGFGESQPIDTNDTPEGRQNNRRTEFVIVQ
ncbi:MAG: OmpA family protein [Saprospiraceae bacterium]|nr:OmpA family protein [Saprospiraceae bacterium]